MSYNYSQKTGEFCNNSTGTCAKGYSGYKGETDETKHNSGPIPKGDYTVTNSCANDHGRCNLQPDKSNNMHGRSGFQIHGDNGKGDNSASNGCVILNQKDRSGLEKGDRVHVTD